MVSASAQPFASEGMTQLLKLPIVNSLRHVAEENPEDVQALRSAVTNVVAPVVTAAAALAHEEDMRKLHIKLIDDTPLATIIGFLDDLQEEDETESLAQLSSIPGAVLVGADDIFTPVASSEYIVQHWPAARLTVVPSAGHMLPLENPAAVNTAISAVLAAATP